MELKLFGKSVFEYKNKQGSIYFEQSRNKLKGSPYLPDFHTMETHRGGSPYDEMVVIESINGASVTTSQGSGGSVAIPAKAKKEKLKIQLTPKAVFELKMLNNGSFKLITDEAYITLQLKTFQDKLNLLKTSENDFTRGINEISSIIIRLENRKRYKEFHKFYENYAYTTIEKLNKLLKTQDHLKLGGVEQLLADMPKEAVEEMKAYEKHTKQLCDKKPIFYVLGSQDDFKKTAKRRDPILLAQSPFAHAWQILGAWDKEMILLEEL